MVRTRHNKSWARRGFAILWGADTLAELIAPEKVVSIRQVFEMANDWPEELPAADGDALAGVARGDLFHQLDDAVGARVLVLDVLGADRGDQQEPRRQRFAGKVEE